MKKVYLDVAGKMHSLYNELILYPPMGYQIVTQGNSWDKVTSASCKMDGIYSFQQNIMNRIVPVNLAKAYLERFKKPPKGTDLTYATGHLVFRKEPWVVDLEFVTQLSGYNLKHFKRYKKLIENVLSSDYCKKIICWTEAGKKTVIGNMNCQRFEDKVETVPLAVHKKNFSKNYNEKEKIKLLFVGSANIPGEIEINGGKEVMEAFVQLNKIYDNIELVVRSDIPQYLKVKYGKFDNLKTIENIIPWQQLEYEFKSSDIFLFPAHTTPGMVILDAMSYELPVITTDVWANPELVNDGKTGFVIKKSDMIQYYTENFIPNWSAPESLKTIKKITAQEVVKELVEKTSILIEDENLRKEMGKAGRQEIENGEFSIEKRNEKLKRVFDEAVRG